MVHLATAVQHKMAGLVGLAVVLLASGAAAQLRLAALKPCGDTQCQPYEYCRTFDHICSKCSIVCDEKNHNVDRRTCEEECQDYLHDIRYHRKEEHLPTDSNTTLYAQIQKLQVLSTVAIIISLILACIVLGIGAIWIKKKNLMPFLFKKDKNLKINDKARYIGETPISTIRLPKDTTITLPPIPDAVRSNNQVTPVNFNTNHQIMTTFKNPGPVKATTPDTPSSTNKSTKGVVRIPSEDSTYAYDNPALTPSPKAVKANIS